MDRLRIIPLGGLGEVGINMMAYEFGNDIVVVDMGVGFPGAIVSGVQYIIPNYTWLEEHKAQIRGVVITHGHMDHIGAIPYILPKLGFPPVYGLRLSVGLIERRLEEFDFANKAKLIAIDADETLQLGVFRVRPFRVNHSIPDGVGLSILTPVGQVIHTGDWKIDHTSGDAHPMEFNKLARFANEGVLALLSDSTNARVPGHSISEQTLGNTIDKIFEDTHGRIVFTCNSLILTRIQQVLNACVKHKRKLTVVGRSIQNSIEVGLNLGYLKAPKQLFIKSGETKKYPDTSIAVLTTGGQGEELAGLPRMARGEHKQFRLKAGDTAVVSANPIPGNERSMQEMINLLGSQKVRVVYNKLLDIHTSGHARQDELKLMIGLTRPKYFIPIHGEYHMLATHGQLAESVGVARDNVFVVTNGEVVEFDDHGARVTGETVPAEYLFVHASDSGEVTPELIAEQKRLEQDGMVTIVTAFDKTQQQLQPLQISSRGFVYMKQNEALFAELDHELKKQLQIDGCLTSAQAVQEQLRVHAQHFLHEKTGRKPLVVPVVVEVWAWNIQHESWSMN